jgi:hypothetical protein
VHGSNSRGQAFSRKPSGKYGPRSSWARLRNAH